MEIQVHQLEKEGKAMKRLHYKHRLGYEFLWIIGPSSTFKI